VFLPPTSPDHPNRPPSRTQIVEAAWALCLGLPVPARYRLSLKFAMGYATADEYVAIRRLQRMKCPYCSAIRGSWSGNWRSCAACGCAWKFAA
jgi:hypothetical protein